MEEQGLILEHLSGLFRDMESRLNGASGGARHAFHKKSFEALQRVKFPDRKNEDWKYTAVQRLMSSSYALAGETTRAELPAIPGLDSFIIPVVNGRPVKEHIDPSLLAAGVTITLLQDAVDHAAWQATFGAASPGDTMTASRAFELLNHAFAANGFFIHIPDHAVLEKPVEIRVIHDDPAISFSNPLCYILAGAGSQATIFERFESTGPHTGDEAPAGLINFFGRIHLQQNAAIRHIKWQDISPKQHLVYTLHVSQQRDSRFEALAFDHGGLIVRNTIEAGLDETNTYTSLEAGYTANGSQAMDHQTSIRHKAPHCESHELYRGIIDDRATAAFNGKVLVHREAQKTNAYQQNDTLVLSQHALMNSKPQLEIFADDVRCSHGATIGQLDSKALFYLRSRGIKKEAAIAMLKSAFLDVVLEKIHDEAIHTYIRTKMTAAI